jgi:hypothetical protein
MKKEITVRGKKIVVTTEATQEFEGSVLITDPCYYLEDDVWAALCSDVWFENHKSTPFTNAGTIYIGSAKILYSSTAHGDGTYAVEGCRGITQNQFGVDAGMMSVVSLEDFERLTNETPQKGLHAIVEDFDGTVTATDSGNFEGDLTVITDGSNTEPWDGSDSDDDWDDDEDRRADNRSEYGDDDDWDDDDY